MANAKHPSPNKLIFEPGRLQGMGEPLLVRVERMTGTAAQVVPLPIKEGHEAPGPGWSKDDVLNLEQNILMAFGAGTYRFTITDPANDTMTWTQVFPETLYPKKPLVLDGSWPSPSVAAINTGPAQASMPSNAGGYPTMPIMWPQPPPQPIPQPPAGGWQPPPQYNPYMFGGPSPMFQPSFRPFGYPPSQPDEMTRLRQETENAKLAAIESKYQAQMDRLAEQNARLMEEMRRSATAAPIHDDRIEREREARIKAEQEAAAAKHAAELAAITSRIDDSRKGPSEEAQRLERLERERERDEDRRRYEDQIRDMKEENRRREDLLLAELRDLKANANKGPDVMTTMMLQQMQGQHQAQQEIARIQAEAQKESARLQAEATRERAREQETMMSGLRAFMMPPAEVARMVNDATSGQHQFVRTMTSTFGDVANTMREWFSNMANMMQGPGENPVIRVVEGGIETAKNMWVEYQKRMAAMNNAQARVQAEAFRAQQAQAGWQPPPPVAPSAPTPPPPAAQQVYPQQGNGLNGASPPAPSSPTSAPANGNGTPSNDVGNTMRNGGKTDREWFGEALPDVIHLRTGAAEFMKSIARANPRIDKKTGKPVGFGPDQIAGFIMMAADFIQKNGVTNIPAFNYLYVQGMYADLVGIILPDVEAPFREDVVKHLFEYVKNGVPQAAQIGVGSDGEEEEEEENGDEDEDYGGEANNMGAS